ncbi:unnamed protein product [Cylindrotheca closterium]|uniref:Uncharacterized protein n=1 Tax=Cylindrotheca closterium TaxID=2856 RepID=A0AAD2FWG2_9STRA|nr:unnamed protein product [Cylindrotheca closterium]
MGKDPTQHGQASQGWQFWSIGGDDSEQPASHEVKKAPTYQVVNDKKPVKPARHDAPTKLLKSSTNDTNSTIIMKRDGWQFWALGEQPTNDEQTSISVSAPIHKASSSQVIVTSGPKKGWKFWAIGVTDSPNSMNPNDLIPSDNFNNTDQASVALNAKDPVDSRAECAWRYWSQMHHQEELIASPSDFDCQEAWQFWAIGVSDASSQVSLLTEAFEMDPPMVKVVKIRTLQPIEPRNESGWRYWSSMKKDAAILKSKEINTKQGWRFWAIGEANRAAMMDQKQLIASEHFAVEPPIMKPVAPKMSLSQDESGWRYWSRVQQTEDVTKATATNAVSKKQGWQFWAIGSTNHQSSSARKKHQLSSGLQKDSWVIKTKERNEKEARGESDWQYWSKLLTEDAALTSANVGKKQGWQFWALGSSNQASAYRKTVVSEGRDVEFPAIMNSRNTTMDPIEQGGWRYWSRVNEDSHEDLQRDDIMPLSHFPLYSQGATTAATFSANPKFYTIQKKLERIDEEKGSKDTLSCDEDLKIEDSETSQARQPLHADGDNANDSIPLSSVTAAEATKLTTIQETKTITMKKKASNAIQNFKKSLPTFEKQKEKLLSMDSKLRPNKKKHTHSEPPIIPKRGILPKDWVHKSQTRTRNNLASIKEKQERYKQEASLLFAQAEQRKQEERRLNEDMSDWIFEDAVLRGIAATVTNAVDAMEYVVSTFRQTKSTMKEEEEAIQFSNHK